MSLPCIKEKGDQDNQKVFRTSPESLYILYPECLHLFGLLLAEKMKHFSTFCCTKYFLTLTKAKNNLLRVKFYNAAITVGI